MTLTPEGGAAIPVSVTTTRRVQGGSAIPVYGYMTAPTDGRPAMGGPALPVRVLTAADLKQNGGQWTVEGRPHAMPVYTAPAGTMVQGGPALAVYPVNAWPTVPVVPVVPWYLSGGISASACVAAYQPKGAASLAASYVNLANPGTNDAAPGVAPTFNAATGWTFDAASEQYLTTGITHGNNWSAFVQVTDVTDDGNPFGALTTVGGANYLFVDSLTTGVRLSCGSDIKTIGALTAGNFGVTADGGYVNGALQTAAFAAPTVANNSVMVIGARRVDGAVNSYGSLKIRAFAIYNTTLTAPQAAALAAAMAAL